ncbi:tetratricopeptide (TPR) repeat protein [Granulicella aggregans]|uniref:Tetratricopeptide (TPR) repeat protein n=1 Tax=Granulicella aggregans TaxID=474949 RepID=A0A7W7ZA07_9BACT|nr:tetratricopeptide (TPR) repeat protein [Granulicella aggregans]
MSNLHRLRASLFLFACTLFSATAAISQSPDPTTPGRLVLVLPFENRSGDPTLNWIADSFPDTLDRRFNSSGFLTITRDDRQFALDHLGLPIDFRPTRATTIRIAQTLDADYVIVGNYNVADGRIVVQARVLQVKQLSLSAPLEDSSELPKLFDCENAIAWKIARQIDPKFPVALQTFLAAPGGAKLSAFENFIRGIESTSSVDRIKRLQASVNEAPDFAAALLALGKAQYQARQYDQAAATLAKVPADDRVTLEANFFLGLARFNSAKYADAQKAFELVATRLPLPEVLNNEAVAQSRQGKDAVALFRQVIAADPNDPDYHFNLGLAILRQGDPAHAQPEIDTALKLRPFDTEATELKSRIAANLHLTGTPLTNAIAAGGFEPLERIRRTFSEASFRQAAFQLDQVRAMRLATLPPAEQATQYTQLGNDYLAQGLVPEAEREFQTALAGDPKSAAARAGIAQVRERSGADADARSESQASLELAPNAAAYMVLARLDLKQNDLAAASTDVTSALKLDPKNGSAIGMKQQLISRGQSIP